MTTNLTPDTPAQDKAGFLFRYRFWFICLSYFAGFECYQFDRVNIVVLAVGWIYGNRDPQLASLGARHLLQGLFSLSALIVTAAGWIRTWGAAYLRTDVVHDSAVHTERLVADGPYRHLRNPLYLGTLLLAIGLAMLASRLGAVIIVLGNLLIVLRLIAREEAAMLQSQGEAYRAFLAAVPSLWPSLRPSVPAGGMEPKWAQAFQGEIHIWIFALAGFYFAWTLDSHLYLKLLWVAAGAYLVVNVLPRRLRRGTSR